jgi:hypothetical protein
LFIINRRYCWITFTQNYLKEFYFNKKFSYYILTLQTNKPNLLSSCAPDDANRTSGRRDRWIPSLGFPLR